MFFYIGHMKFCFDTAILNLTEIYLTARSATLDAVRYMFYFFKKIAVFI